MYRFLLRPIWILSHVLVVLLVIVLVNLGFWQLRRLDEKRDFNRLVTARSDEPAAPVADVLAATATFDDAAAVVYRKVTASGTYVPDEQVIIRSRTFQGKSGAWLLTPLRLDDGTGVVVNRGWVPVQAGIALEDEWAPPTGRVRVTGLLVGTQTKGRFGATDPEGARLVTMARTDIGRIQEQTSEDLAPAVLQLDTQSPPQQGDFPVAVGPPELSEGPHLNYAGQWFIFATIAVVGYPLVLRRVARNKADERAHEATEAAREAATAPL